MLWPVAVVAGLALDAGFRPDDAVTATAVAMAISRGDDRFITPPFETLGVTYVGLWGVPVPVGDTVSQMQLMVPTANAKAALGAFRASERTWAWAPADVDRAVEAWGEVAAEAVAHPRFGITDLEATADQAMAHAQAVTNAAMAAVLATDTAGA